MSTSFRPIPDIPFNQLFDGRLDKFGVREKAERDPTARIRSLVGSDGVLEAYKNDDGTSFFKRRSFTPFPWSVLDALTEEFEAELVSEHDHRFWRFATKQEETEIHEKLAKESEDKFYQDLIHHLRGEPNGLSAGTVGMRRAEIARILVANDESLLAPDSRQQILEAVDVIYDRDHALKLTLTSKDMAAVELMVARKNELPQG